MNNKTTYRIFVLLIISLLPIIVQAQQIKGGLVAGFNMTMVDGDELFGYKKYGINAGPMVMIPFGKKFTLNIETIYNQKGSHQRAQFDNDSLNGAYHLALDYLEVPFYLQFHDKAGANVGAGLSWGRLVRYSESEHGEKLDWTKSTFPYKRDDWNIFADVTFNIIKGWKINARYFYSLNVLRERTFLNGETRKQYNTGFTFRIIYIINEEVKK